MSKIAKFCCKRFPQSGTLSLPDLIFSSEAENFIVLYLLHFFKKQLPVKNCVRNLILKTLTSLGEIDYNANVSSE